MNNQETLNTLKQLATFAAGVLVMRGYLTHDQAYSLVTDLFVIIPAIAGLASIGSSMYAHWNMKKVPVNSMAIAPPPGMFPAKVGSTLSSVAGARVVGAIALCCLIGFAAPARAQASAPANNACDPLLLFNGVSFKNLAGVEAFIAKIKTCSVDDLQSAIKDAAAQVPSDDAALACYKPVLVLVQGVQTGGLFMTAQTFRDAKRSGVITSCINWFNSTINVQ